MLVYVEEISNRHQYIFDLVLRGILEVEYSFITNKNDFINSTNPKITYAKEAFCTSIFCASTGFLKEREVRQVPLDFIAFDDYQIFFPIKHEASLLPFDFFSAAFYLLTRYEEYLPFEADEHGRFPGKKSVAYRGGFIDKPVINQWAWLLKERLQEQYPALDLQGARSYSFVPTYDIDIAYSYRGKGFLRNCGGLLNDAKRLQFEQMKERLSVLNGQSQDPYDNYEYFHDWQKTYQLHPLYFFPMGKPSKFDRNLSVKTTAVRSLIESVASYSMVGLHPSYASNEQKHLLKEEKISLESILGEEIYRSRQHYIKLRFPETYRALLEAGIKKEYSMGYPDMVGFRASIATSFYFYDLKKEKQEALRIYPFAVMDVSLNDYMRLSPEKAIAVCGGIIKAVKEVDGLFISIWHNQNVSERDNWKGWRNVYEEVLLLALPDEAH